MIGPIGGSSTAAGERLPNTKSAPSIHPSPVEGDGGGDGGGDESGSLAASTAVGGADQGQSWRVRGWTVVRAGGAGQKVVAPLKARLPLADGAPLG